jgi:hypothetical protein
VVYTGIEHRGDVLVRQPPSRAGFAEEEPLVVLSGPWAGDALGKGDLDGHVALDEGVMSEVDPTHGPLADLLEQAVFPESRRMGHHVDVVQYPAARCAASFGSLLYRLSAGADLSPPASVSP